MKFDLVNTVDKLRGIHFGTHSKSELNPPELKKSIHSKDETINLFSSLANCEFIRAGTTHAPHEFMIFAVRINDIDKLVLQDESTGRDMLIPIILMSGHDSMPLSITTLMAGAMNFLTGQEEGKQLQLSFNQAMNKRSRLQKQAHESQSTNTQLMSLLTPREKEVMMGVLDGLTSKEIAAQLGLSFRTIENYRAQVLRKTGCSNMLELSRIATAQVHQ